jgi:L-threonylcarbamoyladenylate synthase
MNKQILSDAISALESGKIVVYPTDTLYGLGADIFNKDAVKKIFNIKERPFDMPLSVAVSCIEDLEKIAYVDDRSKKIIDTFLPGKLTLILKKKKAVPDVVTAGLENIAIRIPENPVALELLSIFGPLTCTSANIHGKETPTVINNIRMQFKNKDIGSFIDYGKLEGKPSTILDLTGKKPKVLREGAVKLGDILDAISNE